MGSKRETRLRWFRKGAAAFDRAFPGMLGAHFNGDVPALYVCPLCNSAFGEEAIDNGSLTLEDVPPKSVGGRPLVLTCADCNHRSGSTLDAHAHRRQKVSRALMGDVRQPLAVRVERDGHTVNALFKAVDGAFILEVGGLTHNSADALEAFKALGPPTPGSPVNVRFDGDAYSDLAANISGLRAGFLAVFAVAGYRFSMDPALAIVKQQILSPTKRLIHSWGIIVPRGARAASRELLVFQDDHRSGVRFDDTIVVFPPPGDVDFYSRLEQTVKALAGTTAQFTLTSYGWPTEPTFGYAD